MARQKDWYPGGRKDQLNLCKKWLMVFAEKDSEQENMYKWQVWGIPQETFTAFGIAYNDALSAYDAVLLSGSRGGPLGTAATVALAALEKSSRDLRRRYFYSPPVSPEDMVLLGVKEKDTSRTPPQTPARTVSVAVSNPELHAVTLTLGPGSGADQDISGFSYNIRVGILFPEGRLPERSPNAPLYITKVPVLPEDLPGQYNRSRKHETWNFSALEAGMTAYFAVTYENSKGATGPWVMISAIIT